MTRDQMKLFAPGSLKSQLWHLSFRIYFCSSRLDTKKVDSSARD